MFCVKIWIQAEDKCMAMKKQWTIIMLSAILILITGIFCAQAEGAQITGQVWVESGIDGLMQNGESSLSKARIVLEQKAADGSVVSMAEQTTGRDGLFAFSVPQAGEYRLYIELPYNYQFTLHGEDSAALPAQKNKSYTPFFTLEDGQMLTANIGATRYTCYVTMYAFEDLNTNGGRMQSEPQIRNVIIDLLYEYDGETYVIASTTTDRKGEASIRELSPGTYKLRVTLPDQYMIGPMGQKINAFYNCVLASESQIGYTDVFTLPPKGSLGMGIGVVRIGSLQGALWHDANANGAWDPDEGSLADASVILHSDALGLTRESNADAQGNYFFNHIQPGNYQLTIRLPEDMIFTRPGQSAITAIAQESTVNVSIQAESTFNMGAVGAMDASSLSLFVYEDTLLLNGTHDRGESPLQDAQIRLIQDGETVASGRTDENGSAFFPSLRSGDVTIHMSLPENTLFAVSETDLFRVNQPSCQAQSTIQIGSETENTIFAAGTVPAASVSGMLFEDPVNLGIYQESYSRLPGFTVQAVDENGFIQASAITDQQGLFTLSPLLPGEFTLRFLLNDPYVASPYDDSAPENNAIISQAPEYGETAAFMLIPGEMKEKMNAAIFRAGVVDGYVLLNRNHDNLLTNEGGMANVTVTLLDEYGAPYSDFSYGITDETGYYYIKGILPGSYSLLYTMPDNGSFTAPMTENREIQSDSFTSVSGSEIRMPDIGGVKTSTLAGTVALTWPPFGEYPVHASVTLTSQTFGIVYETETWDKEYIISGLRPDTYTLQVQIPEGYVINDGEGSPFSASPTSQAQTEIVLAHGEDKLDAHIYVSNPASLEGHLYYDADLSAQQGTDEANAEYRSLTLWRGQQHISDLTTDPQGNFSLENLVPGEYTLAVSLNENEILTGHTSESGIWELPLVLEDWDSIHHLQISLPIFQYASLSGEFWSLDGSKNGLANIPVSLLGTDGNIVTTVQSDAEGAFQFTRLLPGQYTLSAALADGYVFARSQDIQYQDSCIYVLPDGAVHSTTLPIAMGDDISGINIGIGAMGGIGDYAWLDENKNGMQDIGESPMPGIQIELYQHGKLIASTETDVYGFYRLSGLYPGEYEMKVTMHKELKATKHQDQFPLVASILPEGNATTVTVDHILVPSGGRTLHYDLGFQLRKKNVYPAAMDTIPVKDWRPYTER